MHVVLVEPEIPPNTGNVARLCAATRTALHLIEPFGFKLDDAQLKRAGMDYLEMASLTRHDDFARFEDKRRAEGSRLVLFSTRAALPYAHFEFAPGDILLFGRESSGVPEHVHDGADARLTIPMRGGGRSLNVALAAAMAAGEALRQLGEPGEQIENHCQVGLPLVPDAKLARVTDPPLIRPVGGEVLLEQIVGSVSSQEITSEYYEPDEGVTLQDESQREIDQSR